MLEAFRNIFNNKKERQMKALTGLNSNEFSKLSETFGELKNRKRAIGGGSKPTLTLTEKLFFILLELKTYPTFEVMGAFFKVDRSTACRWVQDFIPILEEALGKEAVLPERQIESIEEFIDRFPEVEEVFSDGTERPTQRPGDSQIQKEDYSGKKSAILIKI